MESRKLSKPDEDINVSIEHLRERIRTTIRDHGWALQVVPAGANYKVPFVYTVGLVERGCTSELMVAGMPSITAIEVLNQIAANMVNHGQTIPPDSWPLADGYTLKAATFVPRVAGQFHAGVARFYYGQDVVVTQYIWPDPEHRYPGDEGWDPGLIQPVGNE